MTFIYDISLPGHSVPDPRKALEAIKILGVNSKSLELERMFSESALYVTGMELYSILAEEYTEKIQTASGLKKSYFNIKKGVFDKKFDKNILRIGNMLKGHEFEKRTILPFLQAYNEKGFDIPEQLQEIIDKECSEINTSDEIAWKKSLVDYLKK